MKRLSSVTPVLAALLLGGCVADIRVNAQLDTGTTTAGPVCEPTDPEEHPAVCLDGLDNDCDGLPDCADPDCFGTMECGGGCEPQEHPMVCFDNSDNDCDGIVDCRDDDCLDFCLQNGWEPEDHPLYCEDGLDNDGDGLTDCADPQCFDFCFTGQCDPLLQDCPSGTGCSFDGNTFTCQPAGGLVEGEECGVWWECSPGLTCHDGARIPGCAGPGCCTTFCDLTDPNAGNGCTQQAQGVECVSFDESHPPEPGYEHVGVCAIPL